MTKFSRTAILVVIGLGLICSLVHLACSRKQTTAPTPQLWRQGNIIVQPDSVLLFTKVDLILSHEAITTQDEDFLNGLSESEQQYVIDHYFSAAHTPNFKEFESSGGDMGSVKNDTLGLILVADETVELQRPPSGQTTWGPSGWMHTPACGGDDSDHYVLFQGIPNAYTQHGRLRVWSGQPCVYLAMLTWQWQHNGLLARVYPSNNVYLCIGIRIHFPPFCATPYHTWVSDCRIWMN